jgi:hypothetical protein
LLQSPNMLQPPDEHGQRLWELELISLTGREAEEFEPLCRRFDALMARFVNEFGLPKDDFPFVIYEDMINSPQIAINIGYLELLNPKVIEILQRNLSGSPRWEIVYSVELSDVDWPPMGLLIRKDIIIDSLQRHYFPPEYQTIAYEGSRPGDLRDSIAYTPPHAVFTSLLRKVNHAFEVLLRAAPLAWACNTWRAVKSRLSERWR